MPAKEIWPDFKELPQRTGPAKHQHSGVAEAVWKFNEYFFTIAWSNKNCNELHQKIITYQNVIAVENQLLHQFNQLTPFNLYYKQEEDIVNKYNILCPRF